MLITSFSVFSEEVFGSQKSKDSGLIKQRQERALEIRKNNFEAINQSNGRKMKVTSFGFQQAGEADYFDSER